MLVKHHVILSSAAALVAAPLVKRKTNLAVFLAAAVGQDVDHYLWYAVKFKNPSLRDAYRFFRARYGTSPKKHGLDKSRALHGALPLALVGIAALVDRRLVPVVLGMAFHGAMDALNEYVLMPRLYDDYEAPETPVPVPTWPINGKPAAVKAPRQLSQVR